jgi:circadian clock protein KaiC
MTRQRRKKKTGASLTKQRGLKKVATCVAGLDDILNGGIPRGRTTLVSGGPGSGKSVLGMEFLYRGALSGEPGIFVTFEERAAALRQSALGFGWHLAPLEEAGKFFLMEARVDPEAVLSGTFNLKGLLAIIEGKATAMGANRIVIDAVDVLLRLFDDPARERNELYALHDWLLDREMTTVLTVKVSKDTPTSARYEFLDFMADCVIYLDQRITEQINTRRLRVLKYRGSGFGSNEHPFVITEAGINIIPLLATGLRHKGLGRKVSTGHPRIDSILGGGYYRGSCILITGTSGTGKTTLASTFARVSCERGQKVLYISFEESQESMVSCMLSPGIDLRQPLKAGSLQFLTAIPESMGAEEHLIRAFRAMEAFRPDHVILDAISACNRMGSEAAAFDYLMRLINACKEQGVTIVLTNQATGLKEEQEISGIGISSLVDAVILLRYNEIGGEINRTLLVMKSRGSKHSNQYREFLITDQGIDVVDVYVGEGGMVTGTARYEQEEREAVEQRVREHEIKRKEHEVIEKRAELEAQTAHLRAELEGAEAALESLQMEKGVYWRGREARGKMRGEGLDSSRLGTKRKGAGGKGGPK